MKKHCVRLTFILVALFMMVGSSLAMDIYINKDNSELGNFMADGNRMTLYIFKKDAPGKSMCGTSNDCVKKWPVFYADMVDSEVPMKNSDFATIVRDDGTKQTTYKGSPLYYFVKDTKAGETNGHGINGAWAVAKP